MRVIVCFVESENDPKIFGQMRAKGPEKSPDARGRCQSFRQVPSRRYVSKGVGVR